jgi:mannose-6-phosphate isomerase-like protein (cupin superfamily)
MSIANWRTQVYNVIQSLLFNNPHRVVSYRVKDSEGEWRDRAKITAPVRRLFETEAPTARTCLKTIQFVHHMLIPPLGRHVEELHIHPDAEELVVVTKGRGIAIIDGKEHVIAPEDVLHIPPGVEHEICNTGEELLGLVFINVPTGTGITRLQQAIQDEPQ